MGARATERVRTIGIVVNHEKPEAHGVLLSLLKELRTTQCTVRATASTLSDAPAADRERAEIGEWSAADLAVVIGGDGTILSAARRLAQSGTPILGVHLGGLGFLSEVTVADMTAAVHRVLDGDFAIDERTMLRADVVDAGGRTRPAGLALNDAVVTRPDAARTIRLAVWVGDEEMGSFLADGVIVSTPTGSTAYALSAGGPLVLPAIDAMIVTPICPHTLSLRPVVAPDTTPVRLGVIGPTSARLSLDGQSDMDVAPGEVVITSRAAERTRLVRLDPRTPLGVARLRLGWGGRA